MGPIFKGYWVIYLDVWKNHWFWRKFGKNKLWPCLLLQTLLQNSKLPLCYGNHWKAVSGSFPLITITWGPMHSDATSTLRKLFFFDLNKPRNWSDPQPSSFEFILGDLSWFELTWVNLSWFELTWVDLSWPELTWVDLSWLELIWADLSWLELTWIDLS